MAWTRFDGNMFLQTKIHNKYYNNRKKNKAWHFKVKVYPFNIILCNIVGKYCDATLMKTWKGLLMKNVALISECSYSRPNNHPTEIVVLSFRRQKSHSRPWGLGSRAYIKTCLSLPFQTLCFGACALVGLTIVPLRIHSQIASHSSALTGDQLSTLENQLTWTILWKPHLKSDFDKNWQSGCCK